MVLIKDDKILLYGGTTSPEDQIKKGNLKLLNDLFIFNFKQRHWEEPMIGGNYPSPRVFLTVGCNYPQKAGITGELLLLGGCEDPDKPKLVDSSMFLLSQTDGQNWKLVEMENSKLSKQGSLYDDDESQDLTPILKQVHMTDQEILEEEYGRSETMIQKLKIEVSEMEVNLKQERLKNLNFNENAKNFTEEARNLQAEAAKYREDASQNIKSLEERKRGNQHIIDKLVESLALKQKQRKIVQARIILLEQSMEAAEDFIVHLDRFFSDAIQQNTLDSVLKSTVFNEIVRKKEEHTQVLIKFKTAYEECLKAENKILEGQDRLLEALRSLKIESVLASKLSEKQMSLLKQFNLHKS